VAYSPNRKKRNPNLSSAERAHNARRAACARWRKPKKIIKDHAILDAFCRKYGLKALYAFGSVLRRDFGPKSDVDLLYKGTIDFSTLCRATDELEIIFGRKVDFINFDVFVYGRNRTRCDHILSTAVLLWELDEESL
jgi:predicted nucleotidyltransferase